MSRITEEIDIGDCVEYLMFKCPAASCAYVSKIKGSDMTLDVDESYGLNIPHMVIRCPMCRQELRLRD
jgi:hypothetical protein